MSPEAESNTISLGLLHGDEICNAAYEKEVAGISTYERKQIEVCRMSGFDVFEQKHNGRNIADQIAENQRCRREHDRCIDIIARCPKEANYRLRNSILDDTFNEDEESAKQCDKMPVDEVENGARRHLPAAKNNSGYGQRRNFSGNAGKEQYYQHSRQQKCLV